MKLDPKIATKTRTYKYLYPVINAYKDNYLNILLNSVLKVLVTIKDRDKEIQGENIYIAINKNLSKRFLELLNYTRNKEYYVTDYPYDENIHVIVIKIPEEYIESYYAFIKGRYSKMFSEEDLNKLFSNRIKKNDESVKVLKKDSSLNNKIKNIIKDFYNVVISEEEAEEFEKDLPPLLFKEEIL